jgi:hypothetical protein
VRLQGSALGWGLSPTLAQVLLQGLQCVLG